MKRARDLALTGGLLCAAAVLFAIPALYVPGAAAVLGAALAPAWVALGVRRAHVTLALGAPEAHEGERVPMRIRVERAATALPGGTLTAWPGVPARRLRRRHEEVEASLLARRRGRQPVGPARLNVIDPLGVCSREVRSAAPELLVLPRVFALDRRTLALLDGLSATSSRRDAAEVDSLRAHLSGTPAARIHWPTVARTGELMERSPASDPEPAALIVLDASSPASPGSLDAAVRATASLCAHLARRGGCRVLLPGDRAAKVLRGDAGSLLGLLRRLALVEATVSAPALGRRASRGFTLYVTASEGLAAFAAAGGGYRIGPHPLPGSGASFTLAGCTAQPLESETWARSA